ncbi:GAP family protein [Conexibacter sp. JD483]|uniref:GAP family protein n=1 Tax=unclassified Conexibacter TaxID=2627773 RepID=UPI002719F470|nr:MULTISPECIES: GAP family protein [unclassified Conexibacter]MDO8188567.1 GAP family protein [Conexibacter sp. CPCC 205706]MDO8199950.1 GAP family protein [Conexibacter sp. CPCC 205762]MDR9370690.1 GAP family protein [Conexibacter sp. JD483]
MSLLLLALEAALYPTLLAVVVLLLTLDRPVRLLAAYLAGGLTISVALGIAIVAGLGGSSALASSRSGLSVAADLTIGALAVMAAVALAAHADERVRARRHSAPPPDAGRREPWSQRLLARGSTPLVFLAAMAINLPGAAYLIALKDIAAADHSLATEIALIVVFNLIMFLLAEVPLAGLLIAPARTRELVERGNGWLSAHGRELAIGVSATFGAFLIARGLVHGA